MSYLTEQSLREIMSLMFKDVEYNKQVPNSGIKGRPDFRMESEKLIVEFDGYQHYNNSKTIIRDIEKDTTYKNMGYNIIRIPYFIQLNFQIYANLFNYDDIIHNIKFSDYPHGFIDDKALLPCDFCEMGIERFKNDLKIYNIVYDDVISSLKNNIKKLGDIRLVLPKSLYHLID